MDYELLKLREYDYWTAYLNESQAYLGRLYVAAKRDGDLDLMDSTDMERHELVYICRDAKRALQDLFKPDRLNYAALSNTWHHLHVHLIPRYAAPRTYEGTTFTDPRPDGAPWPYDKEFKVPEPVLFKIRDELKARL